MASRAALACTTRKLAGSAGQLDVSMPMRIWRAQISLYVFTFGIIMQIPMQRCRHSCSTTHRERARNPRMSSRTECPRFKIPNDGNTSTYYQMRCTMMTISAEGVFIFLKYIFSWWKIATLLLRTNTLVSSEMPPFAPSLGQSWQSINLRHLANLVLPYSSDRWR